jgi:anti-sigma factor RsiW
MNDHIEGVEISAFLDGALAAAERARVDAHLSACGACRRELDSLRHLKLVASSAPRRTLPADLALSLEHRFVGPQPRWKALARPGFWIPAGAVAAAALAFSVWARTAAPSDELPLEPLLAAHERYSAEALIPEAHLVASSYSDQAATIDADGADTGAE